MSVGRNCGRLVRISSTNEAIDAPLARSSSHRWPAQRGMRWAKAGSAPRRAAFEDRVARKSGLGVAAGEGEAHRGPPWPAARRTRRARRRRGARGRGRALRRHSRSRSAPCAPSTATFARTRSRGRPPSPHPCTAHACTTCGARQAGASTGGGPRRETRGHERAHARVGRRRGGACAAARARQAPPRAPQG